MYNNGNSSKNVTGASIVDGTVANVDIDASAAIAQSKLATLVITNAEVADNALSGDKIDAGIISNFQSTGIDDRSPTGKVLTLTDSLTTVDSRLEAKYPVGAVVTLEATNASSPANWLEWKDTSGRTGYMGFSANGNDNFTLTNEKNGYMVFSTNNAEGFRLDTSQNFVQPAGKRIFSPGTYSATHSNAANVYIDSNNALYRSTSSIKYKKDVETLEDSYADAVLNLRPVFFRSKTTEDNPTWSHWGFIAEEVAEIDPRLVFWKTSETVETLNPETGELETTTTKLETPEPEGVQYDRVIPHLVNLAQRQNAAIEALTTRIEQLETI
jgi:hypothetical protein